MFTRRLSRKSDLLIFDDLMVQLERAFPGLFQLPHTLCDSHAPEIAIQADNLLVGLQYSNGHLLFDPRMYIMKVYSFEDYVKFASIHASVVDAHAYSTSMLASAPELLPEQGSALGYLPPIKSALILGPEKRSRKIRKFFNNYNIEVFSYNERLTFDALEQFDNIDLAVTNGYAYRLENETISNIKGPILNLHVTYLPWGRGIGTIFYAALLDQPTGISIHKIDDHNIDAGPILLRKQILLNTHLTTRDTHTILTELAEDIFTENFFALYRGGLKEYPNQLQNTNSNPPYFSRYNFESLVRFFPLGYDTTLKTLQEFGLICKASFTARVL